VISFELSEEIAELCAAARRLAEQELRPNVREFEQEGRWPAKVLQVLKGFDMDELDMTARVALLETLAQGDAGGLPGADPIAIVVADADDDPPSRVEWAPSTAPRQWWVSQGTSLRLVEVVAEPKPVQALAFHASGGVTISLEGAEVLEERELQVTEAVAGRARLRLWLAAVAVGVAQDALDATLAYTTERVVFGKPVAYHQGNAFELAGLATNLHGSRLAVRDAAARFDAGDPYAGFWATQAWLTAVDTAVAVTDAGVQLLGGHGFLVDHLAEKRFREARMLGLLAGGRDAAEADIASLVLEVPDPLFA
jgi:alkylation response protein AidB-like acyl-CoA dehydrogenase